METFMPYKTKRPDRWQIVGTYFSTRANASQNKTLSREILQNLKIFFSVLFSVAFRESQNSVRVGRRRAKKVVIVVAARKPSPISQVIPCCEGSYTFWLSAKKNLSQGPSEVRSRARNEHAPALDGEVRRFP